MPRRRRLSHGCGRGRCSRRLLMVMLDKQRRLLPPDLLHNHLRRGGGGGKTPEIRPRRQRPEPSRSPSRGAHQRPHRPYRGAHSDPTVVFPPIPALLLRPDPLPEYKRRGAPEQGLVLQSRGIPGRRERAQGVGVGPGAHGDGDGGEAGRGGAGPCGGYNRGLGLAEEPLDGLAVGFVAELAGQLEDPGGAYDGHPDSPSPAVHLAVTVLGRRLLHG
ncbi:hypothetical protein Tsubulata_010895 [Turnera subulata]|uniref:Uncharacterized protein n=1 Tax=Turnera subulata TaxID=218843 RepID=A0A9Q0JDN4_9ROSI|nr:hypothetical protein Tsubulata_010895 [Turnera subulata]